MASITVRGLEEEVKTAIRVRAAEHGHSMEEEARQILRSAVGCENNRISTGSRKKISKPNGKGEITEQTNSHAKVGAEKTDTEKWLDELEQSGVLVRAITRSRNFSPGDLCPGALERFLTER